MTNIGIRGGIRSRLNTGTADTQKLNWWGRRWIEILSNNIEHARYTRGKSCAKRGQVISLEIEPGLVSAIVQGDRPEPYIVRFGFNVLTTEAKAKILSKCRKHAIFAAELFAGRLAHETEEVFLETGIRLFPNIQRLNTFKCTCPSQDSLCEHTIAVYMLLGEAFSNDPFLLLKLYGLDKLSIIKKLSGEAKTEITTDSSDKIVLDLKQDTDDLENWFGKKTFKIPDVKETKKPEAYSVMHEFPFWRGVNPFLDTVKEYYDRAANFSYELLTGEKRLTVGRPKKYI